MSSVEIYVFMSIVIFLFIGICSGFDLTILHTNDVHAHFQQFAARGGQCSDEDATNGECYGGEARRFTKVNEIRQSNPNVLLLDAGDRYSGTLWFTEYKGLAASLFINRLQYDAMCLGNHEFDSGVEGLVPYLNNLTTPVVSANIDVSGEPRLQGKLSKSVTLTVGGERVGVVGYITEETAFASSGGDTVKFSDEVSAVRDEVAVLRGQGVNKIIALGHAGVVKDQQEIAAIEGVDIVVGGHTHTFLYNVAPGEEKPYEDPQGPYPVVVTRSSGTRALVVQDYAWAKYLGHLDVTFDDNGEIVTFSGNPILLDHSITEDPGTLQLVRDMSQPILSLQADVIGRAAVTLDGERLNCRLKECIMGNMITDAVVDYFVNFEHPNTTWASAAIAIWNGGGIRATIPAGDVTVGDVLEVLPFGNEVDRITVRGKTIRDILENSVSKYQPEDPRGRFLQMSGIKVVYNMSRTVRHRVRSIHVRCLHCDEIQYSLLDYAAEYKLFTSSFLIRGGDEFTMIRDDKLSHERFNVLAADILREYIEKHSPVYPSLDKRIAFWNDYIISGSSRVSAYKSIVVVIALFMGAVMNYF